jgi:hypothetical protein
VAVDDLFSCSKTCIIFPVLKKVNKTHFGGGAANSIDFATSALPCYA